MRRTAQFLIAFVATAAAALAGTVTFATPAGAKESGLNPVSATATITTDTNSILITLTDLEADPTTEAQTISGFSFTLSPAMTGSASLTSVTGTLIDISTNGSWADISGTINHWAVSTSINQITGTLNDLTGAQPYDTIIGPPLASTNAYTDGNAGIKNGNFDPFIQDTATFTLTAPGVTKSTVATSATFSFGTSSGDSVNGIVVVPEPGSLLLAGGWLFACGALRKIKFMCV